jgi:hypothetical protein
MDNIITLIVIFIVLGSITRKLKARQKAKQGATPPDGGWLTKLKAALADIQRQIEQQSKGRTSGASGWDQFMDDGEPSVHNPMRMKRPWMTGCLMKRKHSRIRKKCRPQRLSGLRPSDRIKPKACPVSGGARGCTPANRRVRPWPSAAPTCAKR